MPKSSRSLRFTDTSQMPPRMRELVEAQLAAQRNPSQTEVVLLAPRGPGKTTAHGIAMIDSMLEAGQPVPHATPGQIPAFRRGAPARSKYGATAVVVDGFRFDSKREANYYGQLKLRVAAGEVVYFLRQVPIHLPGGTRMVVDFQVFEADGRVRYIDTKGVETKTFKVKRREIEAVYPITIETA